ncbi:MAG: hypothetical protein L7F77_13100 [Candidatus Magnetominusculus sp. LBB02]|nr:hypothetical protein [Candidatus Magnetominusculus sp. LBB02]
MLKVFTVIFGTYFVGALIIEISKRLAEAPDKEDKAFCERRFLPQLKLSSIFHRIIGSK